MVLVEDGFLGLAVIALVGIIASQRRILCLTIISILNFQLFVTIDSKLFFKQVQLCQTSNENRRRRKVETHLGDGGVDDNGLAGDVGHVVTENTAILIGASTLLHVLTLPGRLMQD